MANIGLISRMRQILDESEAGRLSSEQVDLAFQSHMDGVEGIGRMAIHQARDLTYRLVTAHMSDGLEELIDREEVPEVVSDMRRFLRSLPGGADA